MGLSENQEDLKTKWRILGDARSKKGDLAGATQAYEKVVAIDPKCLDVWNELGTIYFKQKKLDLATKAFRQVLALAPTNVSALVNLGSALVAGKRVVQGLKYLDQAAGLGDNQARDLVLQIRSKRKIAARKRDKISMKFADEVRPEKLPQSPQAAPPSTQNRYTIPQLQIMLKTLSEKLERVHTALQAPGETFCEAWMDSVLHPVLKIQQVITNAIDSTLKQGMMEVEFKEPDGNPADLEGTYSELNKMLDQFLLFPPGDLEILAKADNAPVAQLPLDSGSSPLLNYLEHYSALSPSEFEEMVAAMYRAKGWRDVQVVGQSGDMGRDVIAFDRKGRRVYVEVKMHQANIGRPVVQKLHSIMVTQGVERGVIVTSSDFSSSATEYAKELNIKLISGQRFISTCQTLARGNARSDHLSIQLNIPRLREQTLDHFDKCIFGHPAVTSELLQSYQFQPFYLEPHHWVIFSIEHLFSNSSGSWNFTMQYWRASAFINFRNSGRILPTPSPPLMDVKDTKKYLGDNGIAVNEGAKPRSLSLQQMKEIIQAAATCIQRYRGLNNQIYDKECKPSIRNIEIHSTSSFWEITGGASLILTPSNEFSAFYNNNDLMGIKSGTTGSPLNLKKHTFVCQACKNVFPTTFSHRTYRVCRACGMLICRECAKTKKLFGIFTRAWCPDCDSKHQPATSIPAKDRPAMHKTKLAYQKWKN